MNNTITFLKNDIKKLANHDRATLSQRYFKTGAGEYGEGDIFVGLTVPQCRTLAKQYKSLILNDTRQLLHSAVHEERLIGLLILVHNFTRSDNTIKKNIYDFYMDNRGQVNNWDLVDLSAGKIVGAYLIDKPKQILFDLAASQNLWDRRIAMISCSHFIAQGQFETALMIAEILLNDKHDLIQKAAGWMLREIGKRDLKVEEKFLNKHYKIMPRTMLRYAIEKFAEPKRQSYLSKKLS